MSLEKTKKKTTASNGESESSLPKKKKAKNDDKPKGLGLFDHIKHIQRVQDPNYFDTLTELDLKTFNHFMILRALSMNPVLLDDVATFYRFFDVIPSRQFYTLLISLIPKDRNYYPWVKAKKKHNYGKELIRLVSTGFEISPKEAVEHIDILMATDDGRKELCNFCGSYFGLTDEEVEKLMTNNDRDEE